MPAEPPDTDPLVVAALAALDAGGGPGEAVARLRAGPDPEASLRRFGELIRLLFAPPRRDLGAMIAVGRAGVAYGRAEAARPGPEDIAARLRLSAMRLGYNVAANCWPGWGDEGVHPTAEQVGQALAMAEESLVLRQSLDFGADLMGRGHWLVGALLMAAGRDAEAAQAFERAEAAADDAGQDAGVLLARGYRALIDKRDPARRQRGDAALADTLAALEASTDDNARFFIDQLQTAERILA